MTVFARGVAGPAYGFCDKCGLRYDLVDLKTERENGVSRHNRVCPECWDPDHPQNFLWRVRTDDRIALRDPRPDLAEAASRDLFSWNPVGNQQATSELVLSLGKVTVVTT